MKSFVRLLLILAALLAAPVLAPAQAPPPSLPPPVAASAADGGPRIQFNTENYDAGTNLAGDKIRFTFIVTNTGNEMLLVKDVHPSCGCTTVGGALPATTSGGGSLPTSTTSWTHEIPAGQVGIIPIQVATDSLRGAIHKTVTVTSNDPKRPIVTLQIGGTVWVPIEVMPVSVFFGLMPDATNNNNTQTVKIFNRTQTPLAVSNAVCTTNAFAVEIKTNVPGQEFELVVKAALPRNLMPTLGTTTVQGQITVSTSSASKSVLTIPVFETIYPEITVFPPNIPLSSGPLAQPSTTHVFFRDNVSNLKVSDPVVNAPGVTASLTVVQTNRNYSVDVTFPKGFTIEPGQKLALTVTTDSPSFPTLSVPVTPLPTPAPRPMPNPVPMRTGLVPPVPGIRTIVPAPGTSTTPVNSGQH